MILYPSTSLRLNFFRPLAHGDGISSLNSLAVDQNYGIMWTASLFTLTTTLELQSTCPTFRINLTLLSASFSIYLDQNLEFFENQN